jgi:hypothetical protein
MTMVWVWFRGFGWITMKRAKRAVIVNCRALQKAAELSLRAAVLHRIIAVAATGNE